MSRTRGLGAEHDQRRLDIAEAVLSVVDERGVSAVSLNTVAERANVSPGRVQYYYPTKVSMLEAGFDLASKRAIERITELVGGNQEAAAPGELLAAVLTELIPHDERSWTHLRIRQAFAALALHDEEIAARMRTAYERLHREDIAGLLLREQVSGRVATDLDTYGTAVGLVAFAEGLTYYVLVGVTDPAHARGLVIDRVAELYRG